MKFLSLLILSLMTDVQDCQMQFNQTAYRTTITTLRCDSQSQRAFSNGTVWFFCKESNGSCEEISTQSSHVPNRTLLTKTGGGLSLSISHVSPHDAGVYWCGVADKDGKNRTALMKINVEVKSVTTFWRRPATGQNFSFFCVYLDDVATKFICKGEDPSTCESLVNTTKPHGSPRFSMRDDKAKKNISVTIRAVTAADSGTYWCGEESASRHRSPTFLRRMLLRVSPSSTSAENVFGSFGGFVALVVSVSVLALLLLIIVFILIYKWFFLSKSSGHREAAPHPTEENIYEEILEDFQVTDTPTSDPSKLLYSTISFENRTNGETLVIKPSSSACQYSPLKIKPTCHSPRPITHRHMSDDDDDWLN